MARLWMAGAEVEAGADTSGPDGQASGTTVTRDTATKRSGNASWKYDSGAGNGTPLNIGPAAPSGTATTYFRIYVNAAAAPGTAAGILTAGNAIGSDPTVRFRTDGTLELLVGSAVQGSPSASVTDGSWHRVEMQIVCSGGNVTSVDVRLDGTSFATWSGSQAVSVGNYRFGWLQQPGANQVMYVDDAAVNDNSGAANNSWCGDGKVVMAFAISDNARGNWTAGAGGTTNLWDAVNNTPPAGVADSSATNTSQIKIKSTSLPSNCDLNTDTYTNLGVGASDTVNAVVLYAAHGEDPGTGTKAGTIEVVSNPAIGTASFNFGDDSGAQGTYRNLWRWKSTAVSNAPSVTLASALVIRITCTSGSTGTRAASCCFLGAYADYTPAAAGTSDPSAWLNERHTPRRRMIQRM